MYQSIPSLTIRPDPPPDKPRGLFLKEGMPHPPGTKKVQNPHPWNRKIVLKPYLRGNYFKNPARKHKTRDRIMKNSTEMLKNL